MGVRNLIKERQKYLFRSLYTTQRTPIGVLFASVLGTGVPSVAPHTEGVAELGSHFASKAMGARSQEPRAKIFAQRANTLVPAVISRKRLAISPILCYTKHRKAVRI